MNTQEITGKSIKTGSSHHSHADLYELFLDGIQDIFWAENHLVKALPKMIQSSSSIKLKTALESHLAETKNHVKSLSEVFIKLGENEQAKTCEAMKGILEEATDLLKETSEMEKEVVDVSIVMAGQKVEHYEIATYSTLIEIANNLNLPEVAILLKNTLKDENAASSKLTQILEGDIFKMVEVGMKN